MGFHLSRYAMRVRLQQRRLELEDPRELKKKKMLQKKDVTMLVRANSELLRL